MPNDEEDSKAGYAANADALAVQYESIAFVKTHRDTLHLLPEAPSRVLDIGAGTGRDAAALAALGHKVVAIEPTTELRSHGDRLHAGKGIEWVGDELPELPRILTRRQTYDLIYLTGVFMHLDKKERERAMPRLRQLVAPAGLIIMSLRHGPIPDGRRMFEVSAKETVALAGRSGLEPVFQGERPDMLGRPFVRWSILASALAQRVSVAEFSDHARESRMAWEAATKRRVRPCWRLLTPAAGDPSRKLSSSSTKVASGPSARAALL